MLAHLPSARQTGFQTALWVIALCAPSVAGPLESTLFRHIAWQAALDRVGLSPGVIDGRIGPKTTLATREFQRVRGMSITGRLDRETAAALGVDPDHAVGKYTLHSRDFDQIGPCPTSWIERSKLKRLEYESLESALAERFHCTRQLLRTLNPGSDLGVLKSGDDLLVPIVSEPDRWPLAARLEVHLGEKIIRVIDGEGQLAALLHCSIAKSRSKMPEGQALISKIVQDPVYTFDPEMWPEVREKIDGKLDIPSGPRNPVGSCWIGLNRPGYGIHGTPRPELIGKTGSHGCFRLTNWDAVRLSRMVRVSTRVRFISPGGVNLAHANPNADR